MNEEKKAKLISLGVKVGIPLLIAILSLTLFGGILSSPKTYNGAITYLDKKESNVLEMTAASTAASAAISLLPGDAGTPIAEKLLDLTSYFVVISAAVLFEKYLMTVAGFIGFKILIPIAMVLLAAGFYWKDYGRKLQELAVRLTLFSIIITAVVPASVAISQKIESTYQTTIDQTIADAKENTDDINNAVSESAVSDNSETINNTSSGTASTESEDISSETSSSSKERKGFFGNLIDKAGNTAKSIGDGAKDLAKDAGETITNTVSNAGEAISNAADIVANVVSDALTGFENTLNNMIEAIAIMLVTSCLIPIVVLIFLIWITKLIFGVSFPKVPIMSKIPGASKVSKLIKSVEPEKKDQE